jgi:hypothetical protein
MGIELCDRGVVPPQHGERDRRADDDEEPILGGRRAGLLSEKAYQQATTARTDSRASGTSMAPAKLPSG